MVENVHKYILNKIKPDLTFVLKVNLNKAQSRLNKRKNKNRYDKFPKSFYKRAQNAFIKIAKKNKKYFILDNSHDDSDVEKKIFDIVISKLKKK